MKTRTVAADGRMGQAIMNAVSDESSRKIVGSIISRGRSVGKICSETGVPLSTAYRRVHEMADEGLILLERVVLTKDGEKYAIYRSTFSKVTAGFTSGDFRVRGTPNNGVPDITYRLWQLAVNHQDAPLVSVGRIQNMPQASDLLDMNDTKNYPANR